MSFDMWTCQEGPIFPKWKQPAKKETFLWTGPLKFCGAYVLHSFLDGWFMLITYPGSTFNLYKWIPFPSPSLKTSTDGLVAVPQRMPQAKLQSTTWQHKGPANQMASSLWLSWLGWIPKITAEPTGQRLMVGSTVLSTCLGCKKKW